MNRTVQQPAGSPTAGEPAFLAVGRLRRPHGVRGEALVDVLTDFPERLQPDTVVYAGEQHLRLTIRSRRHHNEGLLLAFVGLDTPEAVGQLRNQILYVSGADRPPLPEGEYYHHQLIGLAVQDERGLVLGVLTEILETGANDVYVVTAVGGNEILLPVIPGVVLDVDLPAKTMRVHLPAGLMDGTVDA
jgi:16S rRNA processing protein RimM